MDDTLPLVINVSLVSFNPEQFPVFFFSPMALTLKSLSQISSMFHNLDLSGLFSLLDSDLKTGNRTSLVAQWLRIRLPMQGTRVQALVWEDPTCCRATKPVHHSYGACALQPTSHSYWAHVPQLKPALRNEEYPPLAANRESLRPAMKTQRSQNLNK